MARWSGHPQGATRLAARPGPDQGGSGPAAPYPEAVQRVTTEQPTPTPGPVGGGRPRTGRAWLVVPLFVSAALLVIVAGRLDAPFSPSFDGFNTAVWATGARAVRTDGWWDARLGGRAERVSYPTSYAHHPPLTQVEASVSGALLGDHRWAYRLVAALEPRRDLVLLGLAGGVRVHAGAPFRRPPGGRRDPFGPGVRRHAQHGDRVDAGGVRAAVGLASGGTDRRRRGPVRRARRSPGRWRRSRASSWPLGSACWASSEASGTDGAPTLTKPPRWPERSWGCWRTSAGSVG